MVYRRVGFLATLAAGTALLGASFHGMTSVDGELKLAAANPAQGAPADTVDQRRVCDRPGGRHHHGGGPQV